MEGAEGGKRRFPSSSLWMMTTTTTTITQRSHYPTHSAPHLQFMLQSPPSPHTHTQHPIHTHTHTQPLTSNLCCSHHPHTKTLSLSLSAPHLHFMLQRELLVVRGHLQEEALLEVEGHAAGLAVVSDELCCWRW